MPVLSLAETKGPKLCKGFFIIEGHHKDLRLCQNPYRIKFGSEGLYCRLKNHI